jgi:hypothetical protein
MKTHLMKFALILAITMMLGPLPSAWCGNVQTNMMGGGGGFFGGGMMGGGSSMMNQLKVADLNDDTVPEIVIISSGTYLVILDNAGNIIGSKPLPLLPGQTYQTGVAGGLDIADIDGDGIPEIVTTYYVRSYAFWSGIQTSSGTYLVILDNQGNLKDFKKLQ